jgi:hypothetical protein
MKNTQSQGDGPVHQTVAGGFEFKSGRKTIAVEFTDQRFSPHAGSATIWGWLRPLGWVERLAAALPHPVPGSNNHLTPLAKALAFCHGLLCEARKLTHVAYLRRDPLVPELLRQQGVATGYTRQGLKPCQHPLFGRAGRGAAGGPTVAARLAHPPSSAIPSSSSAGNTACANNVAAFFLDLWENLPSHLRLRGALVDRPPYSPPPPRWRARMPAFALRSCWRCGSNWGCPT